MVHSSTVFHLEADYPIGFGKVVLCLFISYLKNFLSPVFIMKVLLHDYNVITFCNDLSCRTMAQNGFGDNAFIIPGSAGPSCFA